MFETESRTVSVVIEKCEIFSPAHPHRITRRQNDVCDGSQTLRPTVGRTKWGSLPIVGTHQRTHLPFCRPASNRRIVPICGHQFSSWLRPLHQTASAF